MKGKKLLLLIVILIFVLGLFINNCNKKQIKEINVDYMVATQGN